MDHSLLSSKVFASAIAFLILGFFVQSVWADPVMFATTRTTSTVIKSVGTSVLNVTGHEYHEIRVLRQMTNFNAGKKR
jgi:hypothetical protein